MEPGKVIDSATMSRLIAESQERSVQFGIHPSIRDPYQRQLSPRELSERKRRNEDLLNVVLEQFVEFYDLLSPEHFIIAMIDREGYILHMTGSEQLKSEFAERNCAPGFRWTERDVGTTAISLSLKHQLPIQLMGCDHFCKKAHALTSAAAPIFGNGKRLAGVLVVSGSTELIHPHTLYMVITAARAAERQLRVLRRNRELALHVGFLDQVIEATSTGMVVVNADGHIWRVNRRGKEILKDDALIGKPINSLKGLRVDLDDIQRNPEAWTNRECRLRRDGRSAHFLFTVKPVVSEQKECLGAVIALEEMGELQKLADSIVGTKAHFTFDSIEGDSPAMRRSISLARKAAQSDATVLLQGETGTGKELFAQAIHNEGGRRSYPFVPINCGAIPGELLESELFGYVEGTFTGAAKGGRPGKFELANGGTLLLDEIGDMPYNMQVKLLRVLQTGEVYRIGGRKPVKVDTRIIASTHVDLRKSVAEGRFREDLFYRLNVLPISIDPLRARGRDDILRLAKLYLSRSMRNPPVLSDDACEALAAYHWPGNVRELENTMERALHLCEDGKLERCHLLLPAGSRRMRIGTLEDMEREMIQATLDETEGNMAQASTILGISRATLYRKVKAYTLG